MSTGALLPPEFWPLALRIGLVLAAGALLIVAVKLVAGRGREREPSGLASLWPRFWVWTGASVLLLTAVGLGRVVLGLVLAGIAVQAIRELCRAFRAAGASAHVAPALVCGIAPILATPLGGSAWLPVALGAALLAAPLWVVVQRGEPDRSLAVALAATVVVCLYVGAPLALLVALRDAPSGFGLVAYAVFVVALADIMGMFGGLAFGRTPITPSISRGKTLEGVLAGVAGALLAAALIRFALPAASPAPYYGVAVLVALAGLAGDLLASAIKRSAGIKDFGRALPGHGGVMDRLDSLLFGVPVVAAFAHLLAGG